MTTYDLTNAVDRVRLLPGGTGHQCCRVHRLRQDTARADLDSYWQDRTQCSPRIGMLWRTLPTLIALIVVMAVACSGPEDEVKDWYYNDSGFHSADFLLLDCGSGRARLHRLEAEISALPDRPGSDRWMQRASALRQSYLADTGWSEVEAEFCGGRITAYDDPSLCAFFASGGVTPRFEYQAAFEYGFFGYCIERSIPPFD